MTGALAIENAGWLWVDGWYVAPEDQVRPGLAKPGAKRWTMAEAWEELCLRCCPAVEAGQCWATPSGDRRWINAVETEWRYRAGEKTQDAKVYWTRSESAHRAPDKPGTGVWLEGFLAWIEATGAKLEGQDDPSNS